MPLFCTAKYDSGWTFRLDPTTSYGIYIMAIDFFHRKSKSCQDSLHIVNFHRLVAAKVWLETIHINEKSDVMNAMVENMANDESSASQVSATMVGLGMVSFLLSFVAMI